MNNVVTIYTTATCPKCSILKDKLKAKNIEFTNIMDMDTLIDKGFSVVPWLEVNGELMDFNKAIKWTNEQE